MDQGQTVDPADYAILKRRVTDLEAQTQMQAQTLLILRQMVDALKRETGTLRNKVGT